MQSSSKGIAQFSETDKQARLSQLTAPTVSIGIAILTNIACFHLLPILVWPALTPVLNMVLYLPELVLDSRGGDLVSNFIINSMTVECHAVVWGLLSFCLGSAAVILSAVNLRISEKIAGLALDQRVKSARLSLMTKAGQLTWLILIALSFLLDIEENIRFLEMPFLYLFLPFCKVPYAVLSISGQALAEHRLVQILGLASPTASALLQEQRELVEQERAIYRLLSRVLQSASLQEAQFHANFCLPILAPKKASVPDGDQVHALVDELIRIKRNNDADKISARYLELLEAD
jgi:hypothetical protein